eukprot:1161327-Pelagomonas_calceolata.AAC.6
MSLGSERNARKNYAFRLPCLRKAAGPLQVLQLQDIDKVRLATKEGGFHLYAHTWLQQQVSFPSPWYNCKHTQAGLLIKAPEYTSFGPACFGATCVP